MSWRCRQRRHRTPCAKSADELPFSPRRGERGDAQVSSLLCPLFQNAHAAMGEGRENYYKIFYPGTMTWLAAMSTTYETWQGCSRSLVLNLDTCPPRQSRGKSRGLLLCLFLLTCLLLYITSPTGNTKWHMSCNDISILEPHTKCCLRDSTCLRTTVVTSAWRKCVRARRWQDC